MRRMSMKRLCFILCFLFAASLATAQPRTLISGDVEHGGYGGPVVKVTQINNETGVMVGGRGGWIINGTYCIGAGGYGLSTIHEAPREAKENPEFLNNDGTQKDLEIGLGYGGVILEYIYASDNLVHFTVDTLIGAGGITYSENFEHENNWDVNDAFFVFEPGFTVELNITEWFRVGAGVSYILAKGIDEGKIVGMDDNDFGGLSGNVMLKFGLF